MIGLRFLDRIRVAERLDRIYRSLRGKRNIATQCLRSSKVHMLGRTGLRGFFGQLPG